MSEDAGGEITRLLHAHRSGDRDAFDALVPLVHEELRGMARRQLRRLRSGETLDSVALVNETYLRLVGETPLDWQDRAHFFGVAARVMRWIVVDHARGRLAQKRGVGAAPVTLDPELAAAPGDVESVLAVNRAVELLQEFNERLARVVECRFFGGMTEGETAEALGISERSVQRDWKQARAWLHRALAGEDAARARPVSTSSGAPRRSSKSSR